MLTPRFKLTQDENHVFITVHAPYTNIGETDIDVDGENFLFVSSPYFLRLRLPGRIVENDQAKGSYTCDTGDFNLTFNKEIPGEHFENLDMITSLLAPREIPNLNPQLVEELDESMSHEVCEEHSKSNNGKIISSSESDSDSTDDPLAKYPYGFANKLTNEFEAIGSEFPKIFELKTPDKVPMRRRHTMRIQHEQAKFSKSHYLADLYDDELISPYLSPKAKWDEPDFSKVIEFTDDEVSLLKELPNKQYLLSKDEYTQVLLGLIDILYAYCYDKRTTLNDSTCESSWTINKLSSTLSWFVVFKDTKEVLTACYRRALTFPIFRHFELCNKVKGDLVSLLHKGKKFAIKCIIEIHQMFNSSYDARYILNQLYIKDYLIFMQKCRDEELDELCNNIANIELTKGDLELNIKELEEAAAIVKKENEEENTAVVENEMALRMAQMSLMPGLHKPNINYYESGDSDPYDSSCDSSSDSSDLDSDDDP